MRHLVRLARTRRTRAAYPSPCKTATTVSSTTQGGGVAGRNEGLIQNATNRAGSIQVVNQYAGGIAGSNSGRIYGCMHAASGNRVLYTGGGFAGGITGCNEVGGELENVTMNGSVTAANGEAGGVTAHNYGSINNVPGLRLGYSRHVGRHRRHYSLQRSRCSDQRCEPVQYGKIRRRRAPVRPGYPRGRPGRL